MITDINFRRLYTELQEETLPDYWNGYFIYRENSPELHEITGIELTNAIQEHKENRGNENYYIDSQIVINGILEKLSSRHNFHRQFSELHPNLHREQILGMQLYTIMLADRDIWVFMETQHPGHMFPHATYFTPRDNPDYQRFCANHNPSNE